MRSTNSKHEDNRADQKPKKVIHTLFNMRFTAALVAGTFAVAASAQQTSGSPTVGIDPAQSSVIACIDDCDPTDVGCLARCNPVSTPKTIRQLNRNKQRADE